MTLCEGNDFLGTAGLSKVTSVKHTSWQQDRVIQSLDYPISLDLPEGRVDHSGELGSYRGAPATAWHMVILGFGPH